MGDGALVTHGRQATGLSPHPKSPEIPLPLLDKASIAVLPLQNMSRGPEQE